MILPQKKAYLSAWNFTIRDSVLGLCVLPEPQLKGRIGISEDGPELKKKRDCSHSFQGSSGPCYSQGLAFPSISCPSLCAFGRIGCPFSSLKTPGPTGKMGRRRGLRGGRQNTWIEFLEGGGREPRRADPTLPSPGPGNSLRVRSQRFSATKLYSPRRPMSGRQVNRSNTYSHLNLPNAVSNLAQTLECPPTRTNGLRRPCTPSAGLEFSSCGSPSEESNSPSSPKFSVRKIRIGRPYNSNWVETSHPANRPKVAPKPACHSGPHCLLCTDGPTDPSSPTFLDQLIRGINYLDRSTNTFYTNCPKSLSLPRLAADYLGHAINSIHLDPPDHSGPRSHSNPSTSVDASHNTSTCMVLSHRGAKALQCEDDSVHQSCPHQLRSRNLSPLLSRRPGIKLPELPLPGNGIFSLGRLPKLWEVIRSGWSDPEPISKPCSWW